MLSLKINIEKIQHNIKTIKKLANDLEIVFVSKCLHSNKAFIKAISPWKFGISKIADSYLENLKQLEKLAKKHSLKRVLLRPYAPQDAKRVVAACEIAAASELSYIKALNRAAKKAKKPMQIMLMIDLGDLREGYFYEDKIFRVIDEIRKLKHIKISCLASNLTCLNGVLPSESNLSQLARFASIASQKCGYLIGASGGNSSSMHLLQMGKIPAGITQLRLGDAILFGKDCYDGSLVLGCYKDAFSTKIPVIECKRKPSLPVGKRGLDAFGRELEVRDEGQHIRVILGIGKSSCDESAIEFKKDLGLKILGASSDHLICSSPKRLKIGSQITLILGYLSVLRAYANPLTRIKFTHKGKQ